MYKYPGVLWNFKTILEYDEPLKAIAVSNEPVRYFKIKIKLLGNARKRPFTGLIKNRHKF